MKKCSYCGKVYPDTATVCDIDQQPLWDVNPPPLPGTAPLPPSDPRQIIDNEHLKLLVIFQYIFGGLAFAALIFLFFHFLLMSAVFMNPDMWKSQKNYSGPPPEFFTVFLGCFYLIAGLMIAAVGVANILSANFMRKRKHRTFSFVIACLNCLQVPFGTALGVFTIVVLSRPSVQKQYGS